VRYELVPRRVVQTMELHPLPVVEANRLRVKQLETKAIKQVEDVTKTQNWVFPKIEVGPQNGW